jgi:hypothetical protein
MTQQQIKVLADLGHALNKAEEEGVLKILCNPERQLMTVEKFHEVVVMTLSEWLIETAPERHGDEQ